MRIGGLVKLSLIDYPGKLAAVIFTQGCNFRCPYCHNPELVLPAQFKKSIPEAEVLDFLAARQGKLNGVVLSGGEATLQPDLRAFIRRIKKLGLAVKLDTNGSRPRVLRALLEEGLLDYVAMDVKAALNGYARAAGCARAGARIQESIRILSAAAVTTEFRTTLIKALNTAANLPEMIRLLPPGARYRLQPAHQQRPWLDPALMAREGAGYAPEIFTRLQAQWERGGDNKFSGQIL